MKTILSINDLTKEDLDYIEKQYLIAIDNMNTKIEFPDIEIEFETWKIVNLNYLSPKYPLYKGYADATTPREAKKIVNIDGVDYTIVMYGGVTYWRFEEHESRKKVIDDFVDEMIKPIKNTQSVIDKILYVNDYFVFNNYQTISGYIYDIVTKKNGSLFTGNFTYFCKYIFDKLGVINTLVRYVSNTGSTDGYWLLVKIDNEWYNFGLGYIRENGVNVKLFDINKCVLKSDGFVTTDSEHTVTRPYFFSNPFELNPSCTSTKHDWLEGDITNG